MSTSTTRPVTIRAGTGPGFVLTLIMLNLGSIWGADMFLPLMPQLVGDFGAESVAVQAGVAGYLLGVAVSQVGFGLLGDRLGLRRAALLGCMVHAGASVLCAVAWNLPALLVGRLAQGVGAGSGLVLARAVAGSLFGLTAAGRITALVGVVVGFSPSIAPGTAAVVSHLVGWRWVFALSLAISLVTALLSARVLKAGGGSTTRPLPVIAGFLGIARSRLFWSWCATAVATYAAYYSYLAVTPFVFERAGWRPAESWLLYLNLSVMFAAGSLAARNLLGRGGRDRVAQVLQLGTGIAVTGCAVILVGVVTPTAWVIVALLAGSSVLVFGNGFLLPVSAAGVVNAFGSRPGTAAGMYSFVQMTFAAGGASVVAAICGTSVAALGVSMTVLAVVGAAVRRQASRGLNGGLECQH